MFVGTVARRWRVAFCVYNVYNNALDVASRMKRLQDKHLEGNGPDPKVDRASTRSVPLRSVNQPLYPMRAVVEMTGLTPHVIRVWERRYGAVSPYRTESNRRLYTRADVDRLDLLRRAVDGGHSIGRIATLPGAALAGLVAEVDATRDRASGPARATTSDTPAGPHEAAAEHVREALDASRGLDSERLESVLRRAEVAIGRYATVRHVIHEVLEEIGERWARGDTRIAEEHLTSAVIRNVLGDIVSARPAEAGAAGIVIAAPAGHRHELGCLMAGAAAGMQGWRVVYLGADTPAEEIASAVERSHARAVGLSLVFPAGDPGTAKELRKLVRLLPEDVALVLGGRAAASYRSEAEVAIVLSGLDDLQGTLARLEVERAEQGGPTPPP